MKESEERKPWGFCETPEAKCTMNYCDENGCQNRKRTYAPLKSESEDISARAEERDNEILKIANESWKNQPKPNYELTLDEKIQRSGGYTVGFKEGYKACLAEFADRISDLEELQKEVSNLIEWKNSAMNIFSEIDLQSIGKELNIGLGQSVSENLLSKIKLHTEKNRIEGVLLGLKICKEMWAQGTISHENIYENEVAYKEELSKLGGS